MDDPDPGWLTLRSALGADLDADALAWVQEAYDFARLHYADAQRKDGSAVLAHAVGVTDNLRSVGVRDADLLAAGLLHDVVEQTPVTISDLEARFGPRLAGLVEALTLPPGMTSEQSIQKAGDAGDDALLLRLCDRLDGVRRGPGRPEAARRSFNAAARGLYLPLAHERFPRLASLLEEALKAAEAE
jgi:(p)ppGpp synthase/HD superfamily hydrolase